MPQRVISASFFRRFALGALGALILGAIGWWLTGAKDGSEGTETSPQEVYFYAWGGSPSVNQYLRWSAQQLEAQGIRLVHVKVDDIATAVQSVLQHQSASDAPGAVDLLWINGENFRVLKAAQALQPDLFASIPNTSALAMDSLMLDRDFGESIDGLEVPWGLAQFHLLVRDSVSLTQQQLTAAALLNWSQANPQRFSYPAPPEFHGTTFLKTLLMQLNDYDARLYQPVSEAAAADLLPPLWDYLDQLHPHLWRQGQAFVTSVSAQQNMLSDGVLDIAFSFNPNELATALQTGRLPDNITTAVLGDKAITNSHYLAIPKRSGAKAAALQVINFFISKPAQEQKAALSGWGDPSVRRDLQAAQDLFPAAPELHSSWQDYLEQAWLARYQN